MPIPLFPHTKKQEKKHRENKRKQEISEIIDALKKHTQVALEDDAAPLILEFGCGDGFQIPFLESLGKVIATDLNPGDLPPDSLGIRSNVQATPFKSKQFDFIFSNHVIEHLENPAKSYTELKRIGKNNCVYAFCVPTNFWLLMSIPAQYYVLIKKLFSLLLLEDETFEISNFGGNRTKNKKSFFSALKYLVPQGHPIKKGFLECYKNFKPQNWQNHLENHGFTVKQSIPLLAYGPSEWPIIPTNKKLKQFGTASSLLLILSK